MEYGIPRTTNVLITLGDELLTCNERTCNYVERFTNVCLNLGAYEKCHLVYSHVIYSHTLLFDRSIELKVT